jgi:hypothetical protein
MEDEKTIEQRDCCVPIMVDLESKSFEMPLSYGLSVVDFADDADESRSRSRSMRLWDFKP